MLKKLQLKQRIHACVVSSSSSSSPASSSCDFLAALYSQKRTVFSPQAKANSKRYPLHICPDSFQVHKGLRYARPFLWKVDVFCKGRWMGKTIKNAFEEFDMPQDYFEELVELGHVRVNDQKVSINKVLGQKDVISTNTIICEKPVPHVDHIEVSVDVENKVMAITKPSGIAVHACGRFKKNTLMHIARFEFLQQNYKQLVPDILVQEICARKARKGYSQTKFETKVDYLGTELVAVLSSLKLCHRIDRVTSGVSICGMTDESSSYFTTLLQRGNVQKFYLARVKGKMRTGMIECRKVMQEVNSKIGEWRAIDLEEISEEQRLKNLETKTIMKTALSLLERIDYDPRTDTSLVFCVPITGRTHQLREHLRSTGHEIVNDSFVPSMHTKEEQKYIDMWDERMAVMRKYDIWNDPVQLRKASDEVLEVQLSRHDAIWSTVTHSICLHALRYEVMHPKKPKSVYETHVLPNWVYVPDNYDTNPSMEFSNPDVNRSIQDLIDKYSELAKEYKASVFQS